VERQSVEEQHLMLGAFSSEWVKLRRRSMLLWGFGGGLLFTVFATGIQPPSARAVAVHSPPKFGQ
jgi:hypothetical protein